MRTRDQETVSQFIQALNKGTESLVDHAITISYYMRGAQQYDEVFDLTFFERSRMMKFINMRLESEMDKVKKSKGKLNAIY